LAHAEVVRTLLHAASTGANTDCEVLAVEALCALAANSGSCVVLFLWIFCYCFANFLYLLAGTSERAKLWAMARPYVTAWPPSVMATTQFRALCASAAEHSS
jgi:hypothetical protein